MSEYVPMLIVGLNENEEYIHIRNAKNDESYICPCCGAKIKARAMKSDKVQPHFYHSEGSECSEENIAHWIYKNWLFGHGCKFIINKDGDKKEYTVDDVSIEEIHNTKFGLYKPDITVNTTSGDTLYFEIYYSNKKDVDDYYCKWNELGNDVVEVNTRELIYSNINQSTPMFNVIYSNGEYLKLYMKKGKRDVYANTIKVYKDAISKTACENLKKRFEQLDWFWIMLQKYRLQEVSSEEIINIFNLMEFEDMSSCIDLTKRLSCNNLLSQFYSTINDLFWTNLNSYINNVNSLYPKRLKTKFIQISPQKYILDYELKIKCSKYHPEFNKPFEDKFTDYKRKSSLECLWNRQLYCGNSNLCFKYKKKYYDYSFYKTLTKELDNIVSIIHNVIQSDLILKNIQKLVNKSNIWELCITREYLNDYIFYLKIKNQPWQYNNSINGLKICFEKSYYEDSIKLIHKLPDEYDAYVKNILANQMCILINNINKKDGIDSEYRHFIVDKFKEELNEKTATILHNEISTR